MFASEKFLKDHFGTPKALVSFLAAYGAPTPNVVTVAKWFARGGVPSAWLPILLAYLELEHGRPVSLTPYLGESRE